MQDLHPSASHLNLDLASFSNLNGKIFDSETRTKHDFPLQKKKKKKQHGRLIKDKERRDNSRGAIDILFTASERTSK
jgi:hypothetical protein